MTLESTNAWGAATLLRASAGTGKTHALVEHYVHLVQHEQLSPSQIVAITFTRKAAAELRRRIEVRLAQGVCSERQLVELAHAPIGNFHGLCLRWLDADGPLSEGGDVGDVLGEAEEDEALFVQSAHRAWFSTGSGLSEDVAYVAEACRIDDGLIGSMWTAICRAREEGRDIDVTLLGAPYDPVAVGTAAQQRLSLIRDSLAAACSSPGIFTTDVAKAAVAQVLAPPPPLQWQPGQAWAEQWRAIVKGIRLNTQMARVIDKESLAEAKQGIGHSEAEQHCAAVQERVARLLMAAWHTYVAQKAQRQVNDFSDLIAKVVSKLSCSAALHARMRQQIAAVLVDEAQDVSGLQRTLLHLLVGLAGPAQHSHGRARWFVVGDAKQCIYGFRGADAAMFERLRDDVEKRGGTQQALTHNYRSTPPMLADINALGLHLFGRAYASLSSPPKTPAPVAGLHSDSDSDAAAQGFFVTTAHDAADDEAPARTSVLAEARATARLARAKIEAGINPGDIAILCRALKSQAPTLLRVLAEEGVPVIAVGAGSLFANADVRQWLSWLAWLSCPRQELGLAVALRAPLLQISDDALMALFSPEARAAHATLALRHGDIEPWCAALPAPLRDTLRPGLAALAHKVPIGIAHLSRRSPAVAHEACLHLFETAAQAWQAPHSAQRLANQHRLQAMAERDEARGESSGKAWALRHYRRMQNDEFEAEAAPMARAQRAVTLSSVHRAKGLEWDHVILPLLSRSGNAQGLSLQYDAAVGIVFTPRSLSGPLRSQRFDEARARRAQAEQDEVRRLLYVAVTRARRRVDWVMAAVPSSLRHNFYEHLTALMQRCPERVRPAGIDIAATRAPAAPTSIRSAAPRLNLQPIDWHRPSRVRHSLPVTTLLRAGPRTTDDAAPTPAEAIAAQRTRLQRSAMGTAAHDALAALLGQRHAGRPPLARVVQASLAKHGLALGAAAQASMVAALERFLHSDIGRVLWAMPPGHLECEWPFSVPHVDSGGHTVVLEGKLDLLVQHEGVPWILDFKYGRAPPDPSRHQEQLRAYAWAVHHHFGFTGTTRCTLVYLLSRGAAQSVEYAFDVADLAVVDAHLAALAMPVAPKDKADN